MNTFGEASQQVQNRRQSKRRREQENQAHQSQSQNQRRHRGRQQTGQPRLFCDVCNVYVTHGRTAWRQHVDGVRHRRHDHSLRHFAERGHVVEAVATQEKRGRGSGHSPKAQASGKGPRGSAAPKAFGMDADIRRVLEVIRKELAHHAGWNTTYENAVEQFTETHLRRDWKRMEAELSGMGASWLLGGIGPITPGQLTALSCLIRTRTDSEVTVIVDLQTDDARAASTTAALCVFFDALGSNSYLRKLILQVATSSQWAWDSPQTVERLQAKWRLVMSRAVRALSINVSLREFKLDVPRPLVRDGDAQTLETTVSSAPVRKRLAVLMGTHKRVGSESPFRWMPPNVVQSIVELAIPREPCVLDFRIVPLPGMQWHMGPDLFVVQQFI